MIASLPLEPETRTPQLSAARTVRRTAAHCLSEGFISELQAHGIGRFGVGASDVSKLIRAIGCRLVHDLGDLLGSRIRVQSVSDQ